MEDIATKIFESSYTKLEKMDRVQFDDLSVGNTNILELHDDTKIVELEQLNQVSINSLVIEQENFFQNLANQYEPELPSLDQALINSLYDSTNPRPLALYIHYDDNNVMTQIFQENILWSELCGTYLSEQFVLWEWTLTENNYNELLTIISTHVGEEVASVMHSSSIDSYPLLICLIFDRGQIKIECIIGGLMSDNEAFALLMQARDAFIGRFELPDTTGMSLTTISTENWSIPASTLPQVPNESDEFRRVAADFDGGAPSIVRIDRIENTIWLLQYLNQKEIVDARLKHDESEKLLFHGCPYSAAEQILQQGFDHYRIGRNGSMYGRGFYFSTHRSTSDRYAVPNPFTGEKRILMCRVLVGRSCQGDPTITTCPSNYDSTTNQSDIHVVYSNRHVLPEYLITYK